MIERLHALTEHPYFRRGFMATGLAAASLVLAGCTSTGADTDTGNAYPGTRVTTGTGTNANATPTTINDALEQSLARMQRQVDIGRCRIANAVEPDLDCDGVPDRMDRRPGRADFGDDDGDLVVNAFDRYPNYDDKRMDWDNDTVWDCFDKFAGNDFGDQDRDGILNMNDLQPFVPLQQGGYEQDINQVSVSVGNTLTSDQQLAQQVILQRMRRQQMEKLLAIDTTPPLNGPKKQYPGAKPNPFKNDYDHDHTPDQFDPFPSNPYLDRRNDPYDPRNNNWYDKDPGDDGLWGQRADR